MIRFFQTRLKLVKKKPLNKYNSKVCFKVSITYLLDLYVSFVHGIKKETTLKC